MFNIGMDINFKVEQTEYPVMIIKENVCLHCGKSNTLKIIDKFGKKSDKEIYPFDHIKCTSCGRIFSIQWRNDPEHPGKMFPVAIDPNLKSQFLNSFIDRSTLNKKM